MAAYFLKFNNKDIKQYLTRYIQSSIIMVTKRKELNWGEIRVNKDQLDSGELRMAKAFLTYEQKKLSKLDENIDDINLIKKIKNNIKLYEKQIKELE